MLVQILHGQLLFLRILLGVLVRALQDRLRLLDLQQLHGQQANLLVFLLANQQILLGRLLGQQISQQAYRQVSRRQQLGAPVNPRQLLGRLLGQLFLQRINRQVRAQQQAGQLHF